MSGAGTERPDPEVPERARRRTFTATFKLEILAAYDAAADGEKGALLRRVGLYSSHIVAWRRARDGGAL
ncbi:MAG: IS3 family transposase, partial [Mycobacterium sp.]